MENSLSIISGRSRMQVAHRIPGRVRIKAPLLKHPRLDTDYLEAHVLSLEGVEGVRVNPKAASLVVRHSGAGNIENLIARALSSLPSRAFSTGSRRPAPISRTALGAHLAVAVFSFVLPLPVRMVLAVAVAAPAIHDGIRHLLSSGITVKSLDTLSLGLCFALGNYPAVGLIAFMRIFGDYLKQENDRRSNELLTGLLRHRRRPVWIDVDGVEMACDAISLRPGDVTVCGPGDLVVVDGEVVKGGGVVNTSMITGESLPDHRKEGDRVTSGSLVESGKIWVRADKAGDETFLSGVYDFLEKSLRDKSLPELRGDRLADRLVPLTLGLSAVAGFLSGDLSRAASTASIDYVCSVKFPGAFSVKSSMCAAGEAGVLLKGGRALDALAKVDTLVFDKTGTLTRGRMQVCGIYPAAGWEENELLALSAGLERHYDHPLAESIVRHAVSSGIDLPIAGDVEFLVSRGVSGTVGGKRGLVGNRRFISEMNGIDTSGLDATAERLRGEGKSVLYVASGGKAGGLLSLRDTLRPGAQDTITALKKSGIRKIIVLTGDHGKPSRHLVSRLKGIDGLHWGLLPQDKASIVSQLRERGHCVGVVGDGINDAPALAAADLGICMGHGGDLSRAAAQAVILTDDLRSLAVARDIALRQYGILDRCFSQGFMVNTGLLALALAGILPPLGAALVHNLNTLSLIAYSTIRGRSAIRPARRIRNCDPRAELPEVTAGGTLPI